MRHGARAAAEAAKATRMLRGYAMPWWGGIKVIKHVAMIRYDPSSSVFGHVL